MRVSAAFVADVDSWLRRVCRVGRLALPLPPLVVYTCNEAIRDYIVQTLPRYIIFK